MEKIRGDTQDTNIILHRKEKKKERKKEFAEHIFNKSFQRMKHESDQLLQHF